MVRDVCVTYPASTYGGVLFIDCVINSTKLSASMKAPNEGLLTCGTSISIDMVNIVLWSDVGWLVPFPNSFLCLLDFLPLPSFLYFF